MGVSRSGEGDRAVEEEEEDIDGLSNNGDGCSMLCNIIIKFTLFLTNFIIWVSHFCQLAIIKIMTYVLNNHTALQLLGAGLLALGIYIRIDESTASVNFQQVCLKVLTVCTEQIFIIVN